MNQLIEKTKSEHPPIVYPMIFYSDPQKYNYSTDFFDLFGENKDLAKEIFLSPFQLIGISKISDEEFKKTILRGLLRRAMINVHKNYIK